MNYCVLAIDSKLPKNQLMVEGLYKSPTTNFELFNERFSNLVQELKAQHEPKGISIAGDTNFNILDAKDDVEIKREATKYKELTASFSLMQQIQKPTHIGPTKNSCLDHIMTNFEVEAADVLNHKVSGHQVTIAAWNQH